MSASQQANINGNIVSVLQAGCLFGALVTGWTTTRFGRKPSLQASGIIYIIGSLIQSIVGLGSSKTVALRVLYLSRFIGGIGVGMVSALVPSYVSECTPRKIRGRCTGMIQLANNIGIMLSCTLQSFTPHLSSAHSLGELRHIKGFTNRRNAMADSFHPTNCPRHTLPHLDGLST